MSDLDGNKQITDFVPSNVWKPKQNDIWIQSDNNISKPFYNHQFINIRLKYAVFSEVGV